MVTWHVCSTQLHGAAHGINMTPTCMFRLQTLFALEQCGVKHCLDAVLACDRSEAARTLVRKLSSELVNAQRACTKPTCGLSTRYGTVRICTIHIQLNTANTGSMSGHLICICIHRNPLQLEASIVLASRLIWLRSILHSSLPVVTA